MAKLKSRKLQCKKDAIAYRTRLRLGSIMHKTKLVQHPHNWPLLEEMKINARSKILQSLKNQRNSQKVLSRVLRANTTRSELRMSSSRRYRRRRVATKKPLCSLIQVVTFSSTRNRKGRQAKEKSKHKRFNRRGRSHRRPRKRRARKCRRAKKRHSRRTKTERTRTRRKQMRRRALKHEALEHYNQRRTLRSDFCLHDEYDHTFGPQGNVISENLEVGLDEFRDDPLNVREIYRSLVTSLPGIPADNRKITSIIKDEMPNVRYKNKAAVSKRKISKHKHKSNQPRNKKTKYNTAKRFTQNRLELGRKTLLHERTKEAPRRRGVKKSIRISKMSKADRKYQRKKTYPLSGTNRPATRKFKDDNARYFLQQHLPVVSSSVPFSGR